MIEYWTSISHSSVSNMHITRICARHNGSMTYTLALRHTRWLYIGPLEETGNLNHDEHVDIHENRFPKPRVEADIDNI